MEIKCPKCKKGDYCKKYGNPNDTCFKPFDKVYTESRVPTLRELFEFYKRK